MTTIAMAAPAGPIPYGQPAPYGQPVPYGQSGPYGGSIAMQANNVTLSGSNNGYPPQNNQYNGWN